VLETRAPHLASPAGKVETFELVGNRLRKRLHYGSIWIDSSVQLNGETTGDLKGDWWRAYLKGQRPEPSVKSERPIRTVDLFCGPGGLANGLLQFFAEAGHNVVSELAVDEDGEATKVYAANHATRMTSTESVANLVDFSVRRSSSSISFHYPPELTNDLMLSALHGADVVLAGPPCQGHSNLNNHTRRNDPRNSLYLTVPAFAVAIGAPIVIIENVPAVLHDSSDVVGTAQALLESAGYSVESGVVSAASLGWAQTRKRHFLIARRGSAPLPINEVMVALGDQTPRSVWWAIGDLENSTGSDVVNHVTEVSAENQARIDWLFKNSAYDLDLSERPTSHQNGTTYMSVYGRMRKGEPAPTITTGFMSPGRGRFIHPTQPRVLTAREAARLQGFSDLYQFVVDSGTPPGRTLLSKWIGDAVPMPLGFAAAFSAFASGLP